MYLSRSLLSGLSSGQFSVLAVDEAGFCLSSQLAPVLCRARSLVMAGDHLQLPPVVLSQVRLGYQGWVLTVIMIRMLWTGGWACL